jgi:hypothetical protein
MSGDNILANPFFNKGGPRTIVTGWLANPFYVAVFKNRLDEESVILKTRTRLTEYIKSIHPHLPETSINTIIEAEINDLKSMAESGGIVQGVLNFKTRQLFIDKLISIEVCKVLAAKQNQAYIRYDL